MPSVFADLICHSTLQSQLLCRLLLFLLRAIVLHLQHSSGITCTETNYADVASIT